MVFGLGAGLVAVFFPVSLFQGQLGRYLYGVSRFGVFTYAFDPQTLTGVGAKTMVITNLFFSGVLWFYALVYAWGLNKIMQNTVGGNPFALDNAKVLTLMALNSFSAEVTYILLQCLGLLIIRSQSIPLAPHVNLGGTFLFVGLLLLMLASVFRYGSQLQEDHDEVV